MYKYKVWYQRPEFFPHGIMGAEWLISKGKMPAPDDLEASHVYLMEIEALNLNDAFRKMQAEVWSPNGEASGMIQALDLAHTSMSTGDILVDVTNSRAPHPYIVDTRGFVLLQKVQA